MKLFSKKISLGMGLTVLFAVASAVYSLGYTIAMNKFNSIMSFTREKQTMYGNLSEIDYNIRNLYIGNTDEEKLLEGMYKGYLNAVNDENCKFFTRDEYNEYLKQKKFLPAEVSWDIIDDYIGYLNCGAFGKGFADMFNERIDYFCSNGIKNIIIDLRTSYEGDTEEAFKVLQKCLSQGDLVYSVDKNGKKECICRSESKESVNANIVLLMSKNSSTCAEIIAVGLKDYLGAKIIGETTKGNLIRERVAEISEDFVIIFPDAKYITSKGEDLYKKGILPDEVVDFSEEMINALNEGNLPYSEDEALNSAIKLIDS